MPVYKDYLEGLPELPSSVTADDRIEVRRGSIVYKSGVLQDVLYRLARLEGTVPVPTPAPAPVPAAVPTFDWDFTEGTLPAGVTVVRAGTAGTYTDANGVLAVAAANTVRVQHVGSSFDLGAITPIGDSLFSGHLAGDYDAPWEALGALFTANDFIYNWVGTRDEYNDGQPGDLPISSAGGWTIADITGDISAVAALDPDTLIVSIGTNGLAAASTGISTYLDSLVSALGGLTGKRLFVCSPVQPGWLDTTQMATLYAAMASWCSGRANAYFVDLNDAGLSGVGDFADGTHWTTAGAAKIANLLYAAIAPTVAAGPIGIYCERARTNLVAYGQFPGTGAGWTDLGTPTGTFTPGYVAAPDGDADGGTRLQIAAGDGYFGKRLGVTASGAEEIHASIYAQSQAAGTLLGGMTGDLIEPPVLRFERFEFMHAALAGFNVDLAGSTVATNVSLWGLSIVEGGKLGESLILTNGSAVTRPKEVVTLAVGAAGTYDVKLTFPDGSAQNFPAQVVTTDWALDADDVLDGQNIIARIQLFPAGTAPAPSPVPPPAPPPAAPAGAVWTLSQVNNAIAQSNGANEFVIQGMNGNTNGWRGGSALGMGRRWQNKDPKGWDWPEGNWGDDLFYEWVEPWFVLCNEQGSTGDGWIELYGFDFQIRLVGETSWSRPVATVDTIRWCDDYGIDGAQNFSYSSVATARRAGQERGVSLQVKQNIYPHGGSGLGLIHVPQCHIGTVNNIAASKMSVTFRKDPRSASTWKGGMHISFDPKPNGDGNQGTLPWYVGSHTSITAQATGSWRTLTAVCVKQTADAMNDRVISEADLRLYPPLL